MAIPVKRTPKPVSKPSPVSKAVSKASPRVKPKPSSVAATTPVEKQTVKRTKTTKKAPPVGSSSPKRVAKTPKRKPTKALTSRANPVIPKKRPGSRIGATKNAPSDAEIEARRAKVAMLLAARTPRRRIAEIIGVSVFIVDRDTAACKADFRARAGDAMAHHFADELAYIDELCRRLWAGPLAVSPLDLGAFIQARLISVDRRKLLGLDRPITLEVTGAGGMPLIPTRDDDALLDEIDRLSERLAAMPRRVIQALPPANG